MTDQPTGRAGSLFNNAQPTMAKRAQPAQPERTLAAVPPPEQPPADTSNPEPEDRRVSPDPAPSQPDTPGAPAGKPEPTPAGDDRPKQPKSKKRSQSRKTAAKTQPASPVLERPAPGEQGNITLTVPESVREIMRERRAATGVTYTELVLAAVEATHEKLPDVFRQEAPVQLSGTLFTGNYAQKARLLDRAAGGEQVQVNIRPIETDNQLLTTLFEESGARSLTHYCATALEEYLRPAEREREPAE